jgi:hypothetical protein
MTVERKLVMGLEEIRAVVFECDECRSRVVLARGNLDPLPKACPHGHAWDWENSAGESFAAFIADPTVSQRAGVSLFLEFEVYPETDERTQTKP